MFEPNKDHSQNKPEYFKSLEKQLISLLGTETNWVCNMSQFSGFIYQMLDDVNWAGFYIVNGGQLILGPYQGNVACTPIEIGKGVCGQVAKTGKIERLLNVEDFIGHIACDSASQSELVIPIIINNRIVAVFDLDSPLMGRFTREDEEGILRLVKSFIGLTNWPKTKEPQ